MNALWPLGASVVLLAVATPAHVGEPSAVGARVRLRIGDATQVREVKSGSSYLAQHDLRIHFGLGRAARADRLEIRWRGGMTELAERSRPTRSSPLRKGEA